jgi:hypothetical protein
MIGLRQFFIVLLGAALLLSASRAPAEMVVEPTQVIPNDRLSQIVALRDVSANGGDVSGVIANLSPRPVRDQELLIRYDWLWRNEFRPGDDNPSRAVYYTVPGEIPPGGQTRFTYRVDPPLPVRSDGQFRTSVEVVGLVEVQN